MWGCEQDGRFTETDLLLMEALTLYEESICKGCGISSIFTYDDFNAGEFVYRDDAWCLGCEELEKNRDNHLQPGQKGYVANLMGQPDPNQQPNVHVSADVSEAISAISQLDSQ